MVNVINKTKKILLLLAEISFIMIFFSCQTVQPVKNAKEQEKYALLDDKILELVQKTYGEIQNKDNLLISVKYMSPFQYYSNTIIDSNENYYYFDDYFKNEYDKGGAENRIYLSLTSDKDKFDKMIKYSDFKGDFFEKQIYVTVKEEINLKKLFSGAYFSTSKYYSAFIDKNNNIFVLRNMIIGEYIFFPIKMAERVKTWYEDNKNTKYLINRNISENILKSVVYEIFTKMDFYFTFDDVTINTTNNCNYDIKIKDLDLTFDCNSRLFNFDENTLTFTEYNENYEEQEKLQKNLKNIVR